jgi:hypothetical protein
MNKIQLIRIFAMLIGVAVLLGLEQGLGLAFYIAIPVAILAYVACRLGLETLIAHNTPAE